MDLSPQTTTTSGLSDKSWLDSTHGLDMNRPITLDLTKFVEADHYPDGSIRSGTALAEITATGLFGPYDDALANGQQVMAGHLYEDEKVNAGSTKAGAALFRHGAVRRDKLPATSGIDAAGEADVAAHISYRD
jgi:hypothetical protein